MVEVNDVIECKFVVMLELGRRELYLCYFQEH